MLSLGLSMNPWRSATREHRHRLDVLLHLEEHGRQLLPVVRLGRRDPDQLHQRSGAGLEILELVVHRELHLEPGLVGRLGFRQRQVDLRHGLLEALLLDQRIGQEDVRLGRWRRAGAGDVVLQRLDAFVVLAGDDVELTQVELQLLVLLLRQRLERDGLRERLGRIRRSRSSSECAKPRL